MTLAGKAGKAYPAYSYEVSRAKIREYAAAVGESDARYFSDSDDCVAPPAFAACFTLAHGAETVVADAGPGAAERLLHTAQDFTFGPRTLRPGDVVDCTPRIGDVTTRMGNELVTLEVDCRFRSDGERAVLARTTLAFVPGRDAPS